MYITRNTRMVMDVTTCEETNIALANGWHLLELYVNQGVMHYVLGSYLSDVGFSKNSKEIKK